MPETLHKISSGSTNWGEFSLSWMWQQEAGLWWTFQNRNLPRFTSVYSCYFRVHVLCQLQKLLCLPSQPKESPHIQLCCTGLWRQHSWLLALLVLLHGVTALTPSRWQERKKGQWDTASWSDTRSVEFQTSLGLTWINPCSAAAPAGLHGEAGLGLACTGSQDLY